MLLLRIVLVADFLKFLYNIISLQNNIFQDYIANIVSRLQNIDCNKSTVTGKD